MRTVFLIFLVCFTINSKSASADITEDIRYIYRVFADRNCIGKIGSWFEQNHEILAIIIGPAIIEGQSFSAANSKQAKFKKLVLLNGNKIQSAHKNKIIKLLDYRRSNICQTDTNRISDPILRGFVRSADDSRASLIGKVKSNNAAYADVSKLLAEENTQYEDIIKYWLVKDPDGLSKLESDFTKFSSTLQQFTDILSVGLERHYDIR